MLGHSDRCATKRRPVPGTDRIPRAGLMVAAAKLTCLRRAALGYFIACLLLASELAATRDDRGIGELEQDTVTQPLDQFSTT